MELKSSGVYFPAQPVGVGRAQVPTQLFGSVPSKTDTPFDRHKPAPLHTMGFAYMAQSRAAKPDVKKNTPVQTKRQINYTHRPANSEEFIPPSSSGVSSPGLLEHLFGSKDPSDWGRTQPSADISASFFTTDWYNGNLILKLDGNHVQYKFTDSNINSLNWDCRSNYDLTQIGAMEGDNQSYFYTFAKYTDETKAAALFIDNADGTYVFRSIHAPSKDEPFWLYEGHLGKLTWETFTSEITLITDSVTPNAAFGDEVNRMLKCIQAVLIPLFHIAAILIPSSYAIEPMKLLDKHIYSGKLLYIDKLPRKPPSASPSITDVFGACVSDVFTHIDLLDAIKYIEEASPGNFASLGEVIRQYNDRLTNKINNYDINSLSAHIDRIVEDVFNIKSNDPTVSSSAEPAAVIEPMAETDKKQQVVIRNAYLQIIPRFDEYVNDSLNNDYNIQVLNYLSELADDSKYIVPGVSADTIIEVSANTLNRNENELVLNFVKEKTSVSTGTTLQQVYDTFRAENSIFVADAMKLTKKAQLEFIEKRITNPRMYFNKYIELVKKYAKQDGEEEKPTPKSERVDTFHNPDAKATIPSTFPPPPTENKSVSSTIPATINAILANIPVNIGGQLHAIGNNIEKIEKFYERWTTIIAENNNSSEGELKELQNKIKRGVRDITERVELVEGYMIDSPMTDESRNKITDILAEIKKFTDKYSAIIATMDKDIADFAAKQGGLAAPSEAPLATASKTAPAPNPSEPAINEKEIRDTIAEIDANIAAINEFYTTFAAKKNQPGLKQKTHEMQLINKKLDISVTRVTRDIGRLIATNPFRLEIDEKLATIKKSTGEFPNMLKKVEEYNTQEDAQQAKNNKNQKPNVIVASNAPAPQRPKKPADILRENRERLQAAAAKELVDAQKMAESEKDDEEIDEIVNNHLIEVAILTNAIKLKAIPDEIHLPNTTAEYQYTMYGVNFNFDEEKQNLDNKKVSMTGEEYTAALNQLNEKKNWYAMAKIMHNVVKNARKGIFQFYKEFEEIPKERRDKQINLYNQRAIAIAEKIRTLSKKKQTKTDDEKQQEQQRKLKREAITNEQFILNLKQILVKSEYSKFQQQAAANHVISSINLNGDIKQSTKATEIITKYLEKNASDSLPDALRIEDEVGINKDAITTEIADIDASIIDMLPTYDKLISDIKNDTIVDKNIPKEEIAKAKVSAINIRSNEILTKITMPYNRVKVIENEISTLDQSDEFRIEINGKLSIIKTRMDTSYPDIREKMNGLLKQNM